MTLELVFNLANLFVLPFWAIMIILPNWEVTRKVMGSYLPFVVLAGVYIYFITGSLNADSLEALSNPKLSEIAGFFGEEAAAATGWAHFLTFDLFVGRWIYWQGQKTGIWTVHSLIFCLFAGPIGLLSHIITRWLRVRFNPAITEEETAASPS
ncbi:ABA4-like family protein [Spirulina sp. CS-785/01]|uniref:ABA4-like family protein n=1 Tax=Spirulina sp. CS-785/01 TaxID=3021716 RepID=UPI0023304A43|nr:ABA4-like family protein [Spirulina sp. CS-785/01]MDB9311699.1 ABA4-like family protein [Spirulina sp. CS-785/01]